MRAFVMAAFLLGAGTAAGAAPSSTSAMDTEAVAMDSVRSPFFTAARAPASTKLSLSAAVAQLAKPDYEYRAPALLDAAGRDALATLLHSRDRRALHKLLSHAVPLIRLAALDALTSDATPRELTEAAAQASHNELVEATYHLPGGCVGDHYFFEDVILETVSTRLDDDDIATLYRRGDKALRERLLRQRANDIPSNAALRSAVRDQAAHGDAIAVEQLPALQDPADLALAAQQVAVAPAAVFKQLQGHTDATLIAPVAQWYHGQLARHCVDYSCSDIPDYVWEAFYTYVDSLGEAGDALVQPLFGRTLPAYLHTLHLATLWDTASPAHRDRLERDHGLTDVAQLRRLRAQDLEAARAKALAILRDIEQIERAYQPRTAYVRSAAATDGTAAPAWVIGHCSNNAGPLLQEVLDLLQPVSRNDMDALLLQALTQVSDCGLAPIAAAAALRQQAALDAALLQRLSRSEEEGAFYDLASAIAAHGSTAVRADAKVIWQQRKADFRDELEPAINPLLP